MYSWIYTYKNNLLKFGKVLFSVITDVIFIYKNNNFRKTKSIFKSIRDFLIIDITYYNLHLYRNIFTKNNLHSFPDFFEIFFDSIYILPKIFLIKQCFFINVFVDRRNLKMLFNIIFKKAYLKKNISYFFKINFKKSKDNFLNYLILQRLISKHFWKMYNNMTNNTGVDTKKYFEYLYFLFFIFFKKKIKKSAFLKNIYNVKNYRYFFTKNTMRSNNKIKNTDPFNIIWLINYIDLKHSFYFSKVFLKLNVYVNNSIKIRNFFKININYNSVINYFWPVRYSSNVVLKNLNIFKDKQQVMFLRKNRIFNKSRYSRNRQLYRTGVYWCLWLNVAFVYGSLFFFYRFSINFGFLWWVLAIFMFSLVFSRIIKYRYYNIINIYYELVNFYKWCYLILNNFYTKLSSKIIIFFKKLYQLLYWICFN